MRVVALAMVAAQAVIAAPTAGNWNSQSYAVRRGEVDLINTSDIVYMANVTIGGIRECKLKIGGRELSSLTLFSSCSLHRPARHRILRPMGQTSFRLL